MYLTGERRGDRREEKKGIEEERSEVKRREVVRSAEEKARED